MTMIWGIHNDTLSTELIEGGFVSIGWDELGDLRQIGESRDRLKSALGSARTDAKLGAIAGWAGILLRFGFEMKPGDIVVAPYKPDSTVNIGVVSGDYFFVPNAPTHRHRRAVQWKVLGIQRSTFSQEALWEIGSALTLFKVAKHADEFIAALDAGSAEQAAVTVPVVAAEGAESEEIPLPRAEQITQQTRDFVIDRLKNGLTHRELEFFIADLMKALGYEARVTQRSGDGNVDVIAHRDPLGVEPPVIKIQVKQETGSRGGPDVQQLVGALAPGDLGVFVTLGGYTKDAIAIQRGRQGLRLVTGEALVELVLQNYDKLSDRWRSSIPLTRLLVVDDSADN